MRVGPYVIENESDADYRLDALLANPETATMDRIRRDAEAYIRDDTVKQYFLGQAERRLGAKDGNGSVAETA